MCYLYRNKQPFPSQRLERFRTACMFLDGNSRPLHDTRGNDAREAPVWRPPACLHVCEASTRQIISFALFELEQRDMPGTPQSGQDAQDGHAGAGLLVHRHNRDGYTEILVRQRDHEPLRWVIPRAARREGESVKMCVMRVATKQLGVQSSQVALDFVPMTEVTHIGPATGPATRVAVFTLCAVWPATSPGLCPTEQQEQQEQQPLLQQAPEMATGERVGAFAWTPLDDVDAVELYPGIRITKVMIEELIGGKALQAQSGGEDGRCLDALLCIPRVHEPRGPGSHRRKAGSGKSARSPSMSSRINAENSTHKSSAPRIPFAAGLRTTYYFSYPEYPSRYTTAYPTRIIMKEPMAEYHHASNTLAEDGRTSDTRVSKQLPVSVQLPSHELVNPHEEQEHNPDALGSDGNESEWSESDWSEFDWSEPDRNESDWSESDPDDDDPNDADDE
ncbi:hypothetical protein F4780DRAFT_105765 [Xylariomycetidae sp. FL0641]|nr:hypothetical protein F4780DRAFT_105765 [Xylariomycetidae sp. FL0641]